MSEYRRAGVHVMASCMMAVGHATYVRVSAGFGRTRAQLRLAGCRMKNVQLDRYLFEVDVRACRPHKDSGGLFKQ